MPFASSATFGDSGAATYDKVRHYRIPRGVPGTRATLRHVEREVNRAKKTPEVLELVEYILSRFDGRPWDERSQVAAIQRGLYHGIFYTRDVRGVETLRDGRKIAAKMLRYFRGQGPRPIADCDDYTIIGRGLLESIGFPTKSRAIGTKWPGRYNHVFPMARLSTGQWVGLEATIPGARPFMAPASLTAAPMDVPDLAGLGQTGIEKAVASVLKEVVPATVAPVMEQMRQEVRFLRWVFIGAAVLTGAAAYWLLVRAHRRPQVRRYSA